MLALFLFLFLPQFFVDGNAESKPGQPLIRYVGVLDGSVRGALYDQSFILDPDPLFLPTLYNYGIEPIAITSTEPLSVGEPVPLGPELLLGEVDFIEKYQGRGYYAPRSFDLISIDCARPFEGFGREGPLPRNPDERVGVFRLYYGDRLLLVQDLPVSLDDVLDTTLWMPVSFRVQVLNVSWVGEAFMVNSSGSEQVDKVLRGFVGQLDLAVGLSDGYYRLEFSP